MPRNFEVEGPGNLRDARLFNRLGHHGFASGTKSRDRDSIADNGAVSQPSRRLARLMTPETVELVEIGFDLSGFTLCLDVGAQVVSTDENRALAVQKLQPVL